MKKLFMALLVLISGSVLAHGGHGGRIGAGGWGRGGQPYRYRAVAPGARLAETAAVVGAVEGSQDRYEESTPEEFEVGADEYAAPLAD